MKTDKMWIVTSFTFFVKLTLFIHRLGSEQPFHIKSLIYPSSKRRIGRGNRERGGGRESGREERENGRLMRRIVLADREKCLVCLCRQDKGYLPSGVGRKREEERWDWKKLLFVCVYMCLCLRARVYVRESVCVCERERERER